MVEFTNAQSSTMNYLGHAYLSFGDADLLVGNIAGDHVKGLLALEKYPARVKQGFLLHRKIDEFADNHPANRRAKLLFRTDFGLYAGAIVDTIYDHFLANDPKIFESEKALLAFTQSVYAQIDSRFDLLPPTFARYYPFMKEHNWLYHYRSVKGAERSLQGLARRATNMPPIEPAYITFISGYYNLNQCYFDFMDDMVKYAKSLIGD